VDILSGELSFPTQQLVFLLLRPTTIVIALSIANSSLKKMFIKVKNMTNFHTFS
jgi:hypothetical protein